MSRVAVVKDRELVGVQKTLTRVLKAKALDSRLPDPLLGDEYAERAMRRLDPDYDNRRFGTSQMGLAVPEVADQKMVQPSKEVAIRSAFARLPVKFGTSRARR